MKSSHLIRQAGLYTVITVSAAVAGMMSMSVVAEPVVAEPIVAEPVAAEPVAAEKAPKVHLYRLIDIVPIVPKGTTSSGKQKAEHRRILSLPGNGSKHIDIGHNTFHEGVGSDKPYAYNQDEICYFPSGDMYVNSYGKKVLTTPGYFMLRPARAVTHKTKVITDAVTVCAFAPARPDNWSHRLSQQQIAQIAQESAYPEPIFLHYRDIDVLERPGDENYSRGMITHRRIFSKSTQGVSTIDASHTIYKAGYKTGPYAYKHDQVCWLESGKIAIDNEGERDVMNTGDFVWRQAGARTDSFSVLQDSVSICFFAPAINDGWGHILGLEN